MKNHIVIICILISPYLSHSQNWESLDLDSLDVILVQLYKKADFPKMEEVAIIARKKAKKTDSKIDSTYGRFTFFLASALQKMGKYAEASPLYKEMLDFEKKTFGESSPEYAIGLHNAATFYKEIGRFVEADLLLKTCTQFFEKNKEGHWEEYAKIYVTWGDIKMSLGEEDLAEEFLKKALSIIDEKFGRKHPDYLFCMNNLAILYGRLQRYTEAERLYLESNDLYGEVYGKTHPYYALSYNNLGGLYWNTRQYEKAVEVYEEVIRRLDRAKFPKEHPHYLMGQSNLAAMYEEVGKVKESEKLQVYVIKMLEKQVGQFHPNYINAINNLASLYKATGRVEKGKYLLYEELKINEQVHGKRHSRYIMNLVYLGATYITTKQLDSAKLLLEESIFLNHKTIKSVAEIQYPLSDWIPKQKFTSSEQLIGALDKLSVVYKHQYDRSADLEQLKKCMDALYAIILYGESISNDFIENSDKLAIVGRMADAASKALEINSILQEKAPGQDYAKIAFKLSDYNKSALLSQALQANKARQLWTLPDSIVLKENALKEELSNLEQELVQPQNLASEEKLKDIRQKITRVTHDKEKFLEKLKKDFPRYFETQYANKNIDIERLQKEILNDKQLLIEYFMDDTVLVVVAVSKQKSIFQFNWYSKTVFAKMLDQFRTNITNYNYINANPNKSHQEYTESGYYLYKTILKSVLDSFKGIEHLIIIPDGYLGHIPFEALLTEESAANQVNYSKLPYLLKKYSFSYSYSANILAENYLKEQNIGNGKVLGIAATYSGKETKSEVRANRSPNLQNLREGLEPLASVEKEIEMIAALYNGEYLKKADANERNFKAKASDYSIIHLAMHGLLNTQYPIMSSLAFTENGDSLEDNFLHAYEISQMQLNTNLVVLSACETGYGKFTQGEGVMSLARSFMYAGVPSLVVSLWQVNDHSTAAVMELFYKNLAEGMDKATALQQAKLTYLEIAQGIAAHPAFWSAFIQLGDSRPIASNNQNQWVILGIGALGLLTLAVVVFLRKQKR